VSLTTYLFNGYQKFNFSISNFSLPQFLFLKLLFLLIYLPEVLLCHVFVKNQLHNCMCDKWLNDRSILYIWKFIIMDIVIYINFYVFWIFLLTIELCISILRQLEPNARIGSERVKAMSSHIKYALIWMNLIELP
jgi:hypothetical protein